MGGDPPKAEFRPILSEIKYYYAFTHVSFYTPSLITKIGGEIFLNFNLILPTNILGLCIPKAHILLQNK